MVRAAISTPAHVAFGVCWAYPLGLYIFRPDRRSRAALLLGLGAAAVLHGLFDVAVLYTPVLGVLLVVVALIWSWRRFGWGQLVSPFRYRRNYPLTPCTACNDLVRVLANYCPALWRCPSKRWPAYLRTLPSGEPTGRFILRRMRRPVPGVDTTFAAQVRHPLRHHTPRLMFLRAVGGQPVDARICRLEPRVLAAGHGDGGPS